MTALNIDPGTELLDLPDELRLADGEPQSWLDAPSFLMTPDLARLTGHALDYQWMTWLADELRAAGVPVIEHQGWQYNGRPRSSGPFVARGVLWHHDGSSIGPSPSLARFIFREGRPAEGIPAPLGHLWVCLGCDGAHEVGTWHVGAAGRANHAGIGKGFRAIGEDMGNSSLVGVEVDHTTGEEWDPDLYASLVKGTAGILKRLNADPDKWLAGHKEYAVGRKIDPDALDMETARRDVRARMTAGPLAVPGKATAAALIPFPGGKHFRTGFRCEHGHVAQLRKWLGVGGKHPNLFTKPLQRKVLEFQRANGMRHTEGTPNAQTWRLLQRAARKAGK